MYAIICLILALFLLCCSTVYISLSCGYTTVQLGGPTKVHRGRTQVELQMSYIFITLVICLQKHMDIYGDVGKA